MRPTPRPSSPGPGDAVDAMLSQWARQRPDLDPAAMGIVLRVQALSGILWDRLKETLEPHGLAVFEYEVLSALRRAGPQGGVSAKELCAAHQLTSGSMTNRLDRLEERGLVERRESPRDRRSVTVALTPAGLALVDRALGARMAEADACVAGLDPRSREQLTRLLRELLTGFRGVAAIPALLTAPLAGPGGAGGQVHGSQSVRQLPRPGTGSAPSSRIKSPGSSST